LANHDNNYEMFTVYLQPFSIATVVKKGTHDDELHGEYYN